MSADSGRCCAESWPTRRRSTKQTLYADSLLNLRPVNYLAGTDETEVCSLRARGFGQPPGPGLRHTDNPAVDQTRDNLLFRDEHFLNAEISSSYSYMREGEADGMVP